MKRFIKIVIAIFITITICSTIGIIYTSQHLKDGCEQYRRECYAYITDDNSCYIGIMNTTIGCDTHSFYLEQYCENNATFTCYSKNLTDGRDVCPPSPNCANSTIRIALAFSVSGLAMCMGVFCLMATIKYMQSDTGKAQYEEIE